MASLAPNITALVGSDIAAKLMGVSGGLVALSRIPACNILILGKTLKANTGMSRVYMGIHAGVIYQCSLVVECPDDLRRKAARILSAKYVFLTQGCFGCPH